MRLNTLLHVTIHNLPIFLDETQYVVPRRLHPHVPDHGDLCGDGWRSRLRVPPRLHWRRPYLHSRCADTMTGKTVLKETSEIGSASSEAVVLTRGCFSPMA
jgi:hypothetical protein